MSHTLAEKILQSHTDETVREPGQIVNLSLIHISEPTRL